MKAKFMSDKETANTNYPDLTAGHVYDVIGIEADDYRILNDEGQPYLYDHDLFVIVDDQEPADWETEFGEEGERYAYPPELNEPGFFEDFFDGKTEAIVTFHHYLQRRSARRRLLAAADSAY
jgi:hypothetical protein